MKKYFVDDKILEDLEKMSKLHFEKEEKMKVINDLNNIINSFEVLDSFMKI